MQQLKILIIEDNTEIRESSAEILELAGYQVVQAENGKAGVELSQQNPPDLILCDIMMPELDGYGVLHMLSKNPDLNGIPFIFLTAKAERADIRKGMDMGADDYLTKPFDGTELLNAVESRLNKHKRQQDRRPGSGTAKLQQLIAERKLRILKKKQIVYYEQDIVQGIYLVVSGKVKTYKISENGHELLTGIYSADEYFGVNCFLLDEPYQESAETMEDTQLNFLPKDAINELLNLYPDITRQFIRIVSNNLKEKEEQLLQMAYNSVRKRMALVLVRLLGQNPGSNTLKISRDDLAALAGIASETVSRILSDFKEEKLIDRKGSNIQVLNMQRLATMKN
ncbi:response regulator [Pedobacter sp. HMF7647]|uniref:Response regulator n=1 Tax=Hufsiella arboris TaxID=2695275 RepID=A0A7K1YD16_9SPHI|nr:response regulator [Hufsiella arboris]MXV52472.1 response regulator [Hufsiella arboris]